MKIIENMKIIEIVSAYLTANGYDGLYSSGECACKVGELMPCENPADDCAAGYAAPCDCGDHEYHIQERKP